MRRTANEVFANARWKIKLPMAGKSVIRQKT
jgi:hypothetical protein